MAEQDIIRVPSLYGGISQQPAHLRFPNQVEDAVNAAFSVVDGISKRQGSLFIAKIPRVRIAASGGAGTFAVGDTVTQSTTGATGRFIAEADGYMDLDPLTGTFSLATPGTTLTASGGKTRNAGSTLHIVPADASMRMHAINRDENEQYLVLFGAGTGGTVLKVLGIGNGVSPSLGVLATVTISTAAQTYLDNGTPTADDIRMLTIADYTLIVNTKVATGYSTTLTYSVEATTYADYDAMVAGSPTTTKYYHVLGDTVTHPRGYYQYNSSATNMLDKYKRVAAPTQVKGRLDKTKMPLKLVRTTVSGSAGDPATFTLDTIDWTDRLSGDDATNPLASIFEGEKTISDMAYCRDRLVLAGGENVVMSQAGDIFNFFLDDALNIVDSDPIDRALSSEEVTVIDFIVPFRSSLALFTKAGRQFEVNTSETLTPTTASINPTTRYETLRVRPSLSGETLFFAGRRRFAAVIYEYSYDDIQVSLVAADVTAHVPTLIDLDVRNIVTSPNDRAVFVLPTGGNRMFVYSYFWRDQRKEQSAWTKYDFDDGYVINDAAAIKSNVYILVELDGEWVVERFGIGAEPVAGADGDDTLDITTEEETEVPTAEYLTGPMASTKGIVATNDWGQGVATIGSVTEAWRLANAPCFDTGSAPVTSLREDGGWTYTHSGSSTAVYADGSYIVSASASGTGGFVRAQEQNGGTYIYIYELLVTGTMAIEWTGPGPYRTVYNYTGIITVTANALYNPLAAPEDYEYIAFQASGSNVPQSPLAGSAADLTTNACDVSYDATGFSIDITQVEEGSSSTTTYLYTASLQFEGGAQDVWHNGPSYQNLIDD